MSLLYNISMAERNQTLTFEIWVEGFQCSRWQVGKKSLRTQNLQKSTHCKKKCEETTSGIFSNVPTSWCFQRTKLHLLSCNFLKNVFFQPTRYQVVVKTPSRKLVFREACGSAWLTFSCNLLKLQSSIQKPFSSRRPRKNMIPEVFGDGEKNLIGFLVVVCLFVCLFVCFFVCLL